MQSTVNTIIPARSAASKPKNRHAYPSCSSVLYGSCVAAAAGDVLGEVTNIPRNHPRIGNSDSFKSIPESLCLSPKYPSRRIVEIVRPLSSFESVLDTASVNGSCDLTDERYCEITRTASMDTSASTRDAVRSSGVELVDAPEQGSETHAFPAGDDRYIEHCAKYETDYDLRWDSWVDDSASELAYRNTRQVYRAQLPHPSWMLPRVQEHGRYTASGSDNSVGNYNPYKPYYRPRRQPNKVAKFFQNLVVCDSSYDSVGAKAKRWVRKAKTFGKKVMKKLFN
jgi:hypothetical protein